MAIIFQILITLIVAKLKSNLNKIWNCIIIVLTVYLFFKNFNKIKHNKSFITYNDLSI